jgi:hypothetical protein
MSTALLDAAAALAETLARENAALAALDLHGTAALLAEKQAVAAAFVAAQREAAPHDLQQPAARALATRLRDLAAENRRLLDHALRVQDRVIGCIARALPKALAPGGRGAPTYAASGALAPQRHAGVVISARA